MSELKKTGFHSCNPVAPGIKPAQQSEQTQPEICLSCQDVLDGSETDLQSRFSAYQSGDYETAYILLAPLAQANDCIDITTVLPASGRPITTHMYDDADHAFDMHQEDLADSHLVRRPQLIADAQKRLEQFFSAVLSGQ